MPGVKTAISVEETLFEKVNQLAKEMHVSRSRLFVIAVTDYLKKYENQKLLAQINAAHDDFPKDEELRISEGMKKKQGEILETEQW